MYNILCRMTNFCHRIPTRWRVATITGACSHFESFPDKRIPSPRLLVQAISNSFDVLSCLRCSSRVVLPYNLSFLPRIPVPFPQPPHLVTLGPRPSILQRFRPIAKLFLPGFKETFDLHSMSSSKRACRNLGRRLKRVQEYPT
jgi:hypothetical protein